MLDLTWAPKLKIAAQPTTIKFDSLNETSNNKAFYRIHIKFYLVFIDLVDDRLESGILALLCARDCARCTHRICANASRHHSSSYKTHTEHRSNMNIFNVKMTTPIHYNLKKNRIIIGILPLTERKHSIYFFRPTAKTQSA